MQISHSFEFICKPEQLYRTLADPALATYWWTDECNFDLQTSIATFKWRNFGWTVQMLVKRTEPNSLIEWECIASNMQNTNAWQGSIVTFKIAQLNSNRSRLDFLHDGYKNSPCFNACNAGWAFVLGNSLRSYIETGIGKPFQNDPESGGKQIPKNSPASIVYFEIPAPNIEKAGTFYSSVFGWIITPSSLSSHAYWEVGTGDGQLTGGLDSAASVCDGGIITYMKVDDITTTLDKICESGGSVVRPKFDVGGGYGFSAIFRDPNGNRLGLFSKA